MPLHTIEVIHMIDGAQEHSTALPPRIVRMLIEASEHGGWDPTKIIANAIAYALGPLPEVDDAKHGGGRDGHA